MPTSTDDIWQTAWDAAQPRLEVLRRSPTQSPAPRPLRVNQLDSEQLDNELLSVLKEPLKKCLDMVKSSWGVNHEPELTLLLQAGLYYLSVWSSGATYGAKLQNLKYQLSRRAWLQSSDKAPSGLPRQLLLSHAALTILFPYLHGRIRSHALSKAWPDAPSSDTRRKFWNALSGLENLHGALSLASFVIFLWNGRYRTLADRLLGLRLEPIKRLVTRSVNYDFMNRQMVWHAFTEFLLFLLPLVNTKSLKRQLTHLTTSLQPTSISLPAFVRPLLGLPPVPTSPQMAKSTRQGPYYSLSSSECAICTEDAAPTASHIIAPDSSERTQDIQAAEKWIPEAAPTHPLNTPYITSCGHVYCYVCVADRMLRAADDGDMWECLRCLTPVVRIHRADGDTPEFGEGPRTSRTVGSSSFDVDGSSLVDFDSDAISSGPLSDSD
ncbi:peroxisomal biogenesis factor 2 [Ceratobasidium sp. AG-Ba]|nr:peroxisomal biogenesis factor 2 [Ceratobasidium sp. AG-Ba]